MDHGHGSGAPRAPQSEAEWHLVNGSSEDEGSERSMVQAGMHISRAQTPALRDDGVGSEPPTPESERMADTMLSAPVGAAPEPDGLSGVSAAVVRHGVEGTEVVHVLCLQGLSQEGPLFGFAPASGATGMPLTERNGMGEVAEQDVVQAVDEDGQELLDDGWQTLGCNLTKFLAFLEWPSLLDACRAGMHSAQQYALKVHDMVQQRSTELLVRLRKSIAPVPSARPLPRHLVTVLAVSTVASLLSALFYSRKCRQLHLQLQQRDRELARLVLRILNLQDALQGAGSALVPRLRVVSDIAQELALAHV